jgi:ubiquinone/menaquinone biosynthesis C-methylase UbiE
LIHLLGGKKDKKPASGRGDELAGQKIGVMTEWTKRAEYYHANWAKADALPLHSAEKLLNAISVEPDDDVLDIACGTGTVCNEILKRLTGSGTIVGADISDMTLTIAKSWLSPSAINDLKGFVQMDAENLGFRSVFDKVTCQLALPYFPDPLKAMKEARRVLKDNGKLGLAVSGTIESAPYIGVINKAIMMHVPEKLQKQIMSAFKFASPQPLSGLLDEAGFSNISIRSHTFQYRVDSFEQYWSEFFLNGIGNASRNQILNDSKLASKIKSDAEKLTSPYLKEEKLEFPWEVLVAIANA